MSETLQAALPDQLDEQAERLMRKLCDQDLTIATAESCTGGLVAGALTEIPGSSDVFDRGFVTYSYPAKVAMLGVAQVLLTDHGAVSEQVARAMAEGALSRSKADIALGVTGFAGPAGDDCEEGLVHMALARRNGQVMHRVEHFGAIGRGPVRIEALRVMLEMIEQAIGEMD